MDFKDYYETLGVSRDASQKEIQDAYRKLARKYHPDVAKEAGAEDRFKEVGEAYDVLKDPEKRKKYDRFGSAWKQAQQRTGGAPPGWENVRVEYGPGFEQDFGFGGGGGDAEAFSSLFEELFGGAGGPFGGGGRRPGGGDPFAAFRGGRGFEGAQGFGGQPQPRRGQDVEAELELSLEEAARGGKHTVTLHDPSSGERQRFEVNVPAGIQPGKKLRLSGRGTGGFGGGPAGDLLLRVKVRPHPRFRLDGANLHTRVPVTPWEAALGGEVEVPTLDGRERVRVPAGTSSGRKIRLRGKGFPAAGKKGGGAGDLYAEIHVAVPQTLNDEERELYERLAEVSDFRPRS